MLYFEDFVAGSVNEYGALPVSQDDILAFARRFDAQDFHIDPEKAKASFVGSLIGSGWHSCALLMRLVAEAFLLDSTSMGSPGVEEVKWLRPVKPGDLLKLRWTVAETKESRSRPEMGLVKFRFELLNQRGEPVVEQNNWVMFGRRGSGFEAARGDWLKHSAGYEPPQATVGVEPPAGPTAPPAYFDELVLGLPRLERVVDLLRHEPREAVPVGDAERLHQVPGRPVRDADVADLPGPDQRIER